MDAISSEKLKTRNFQRVFLLAALGLFSSIAHALTLLHYVQTVPSRNAFAIIQKKSAADIVVDTNDFRGVLIAANNLQTDIARVTGILPTRRDEMAPGENPILIGTLGQSEIIRRLVRDGKIDPSSIAGKWESFLIQVVPRPFPGIKNALVICGSDQRGTIFGIYDVSENIGVSPWHFWTDVPPKHHDELFVKAGRFIQGPPAVKYRGIFLNDEAPDLTGWAREKFGGYNHAFYTNVFELLLRLKANYLWPAMWDNCFGEDDPLNAKLADEYGIIMGTSHVEPMMRADKEWGRAGFTAREWNFQTHSNELKSFWREGIQRNKDYEKIITIGMRGKVDSPMSPAANVPLLEEIIAAQRQIISSVMRTNAAAVPQLWALYKEVQEYYEKGMRVPDDVTLLWSDDNYGDLRRVPSASDRLRSGGSGIYYHFDYVGGPRNYKWINSTQNAKTWEQMELAYNYGVNAIWIANVGHLQHVTFPTEFFLTLAWDPKAWPREKISTFAELWAEREFGKPFAPQIANVLSKFTKYNARCKPELLSPGAYSLVNYREADRALAEWKAVAAEAEDINQKLPSNERDAFFETVLYPVKAAEIVNELYIDAAKNRLYAAQGRAVANDYADAVKKLFQADADLSAYYNHALAGGKWDHMMDQTHIGYTTWQQPPTNVMPSVVELKIPDAAAMGVAIEGSTNAWPGCSQEAALPTFDKFNQPSRFIDVFDKGKMPFQFTAQTSAPWILLSSFSKKMAAGPVGRASPRADSRTDVASPPHPQSLSPTGEREEACAFSSNVEKDQRLWVSVDWKKAPRGLTNGFVKISSGTNAVFLTVNVFNPPKPSRNSVRGFVEADGYVSMETEHYSRNVGSRAARWEKIPDLGRTLSAMSIFPATAPSVMLPRNSPRLEYKMFLFDTGKIQVETILSPTLNFVAGRGLRFALSFDDDAPQIVTAVPANYSAGDGNHDWEKTVAESARIIETSFTIKKPGEHVLKVWMVDSGVVLQKIIVNCGGEKPSYLGPPESFHGRPLK